MVLLVVLPSLVYLAPQARDSTIRCPTCREEVPFVVRKFVPREILHTSGAYRFHTYSLECPKDGVFSVPVLGLVDQTTTARRQRISAALHLQLIAQFGAGLDYKMIDKDLQASGVVLSRSTIWRQLRKAPWEELHALHLANRWRRIFHVSAVWEVEQAELSSATFTAPTADERDAVIFGGVLGMVFETPTAAAELKSFLDGYVQHTNYRWTWARVCLFEEFPDDVEMPDDFPCATSLRKCLEIVKTGYEFAAENMGAVAIQVDD
jgi:hypothetical protein